MLAEWYSHAITFADAAEMTASMFVASKQENDSVAALVGAGGSHDYHACLVSA